MGWYITVCVGWFLLLLIVGILLRVCCLCAMRKNAVTQARGRAAGSRQPARVLRSIRIDPPGAELSLNADRQGTVYSVSDDRPHNRYGDIFFIEPGSEEANRIREQLEKDEKDLPSYDEVMRMCNLTTPTAAAAVAGTAQLPPTIDGNLAIGIAALPAPPYSEADPQASPSQTSAFAVPASNPPSINAISMEPSTSRAAQTPTSPASVTVTLPSTVTNTEV
ncbi:uncharacterized protein LOC6652229 isoform X2 [Drosophila willistoni]|uniref:uncharacterized protein LOC6652229 isoform X2 n=1 Tax=Drosophila willistoni TaxID=7260 RepID=UPI000C26C9A7|nr:uncharacterized protein LOC6652229 isoform X2 [Drosophila willistoni]